MKTVLRHANLWTGLALLVMVLIPRAAGTAPLAPSAPIVGSPFDIATGGYDYYAPAVAYNSRHGEYLVVWHNPAGSGIEIGAQRVGSDGTLRGVRYLVAGASGTANWAPDVAYSPIEDAYLIVWTRDAPNGYEIWGRRYSWDLSTWQSQPSAIDTVQPGDSLRNPAVAYSEADNAFIIAWDWEHTVGGLRDVWARTMEANGGHLTPRINVASGGAAGGDGNDRVEPDVAVNLERNQVLIAYVQELGVEGDIRGKAAAATLAGISAAPEIVFVDNVLDQRAVSVAAGPDEFLAVWEDGPSATHRTIYARRLAGDGSLAPTFVPVHDVANEVHAAPVIATAWGGRYLITWHFPFVTGGAFLDTDLYGRYIPARADGPVPGDAFAIDWRLEQQQTPAIACGRGGTCLVVEEDVIIGTSSVIRGVFVGPHHIYLPLTVR